jgi:hypothetical protein
LIVAPGLAAAQSETPTPEPRPAPGLAEMAPETVAEVNGAALTRDQLAGLAVGVHGRQVLEVLITHELVRQEAREAGVRVTAEEMARHLDDRTSRELRRLAETAGCADLAEYAARRGLTEADLAKLRAEAGARLRPLAGPELLARKLIRREVRVTDEEVRAAFRKRHGAKVIARQIVTDTRAQAEAVRERLARGADFERIARAESRDPVTARRGGKLEPLPVDSLLGAAAAGLEPGGVSDVVATPNGYHILKLEERLPPDDAAFEDVADDLREALVERKIRDRRDTWLRDLHKRARIRRRL